MVVPLSFVLAAAQQHETDPLVVAVVAALLGGGGLSALVTMIRAPKQGKLDLMNAAKVLYEEQEKQYEDAKKELVGCRIAMEKVQDERDKLKQSVGVLERELAAEHAEIEFLRERITYVEDQIRRRQREALGEMHDGIIQKKSDDKQ